MTRYRDRYEEIYRILTRSDLQHGAGSLEDIDLGPELFGADRRRWLGFYTHDGLRIALEKYGFYRDLERMGFRKLRLETRTDDPEEHLLRLWSLDPIAPEPLVELVVHRDYILDGVPVLNVQWLMLQNPVAPFTPSRPPLPGQRHPGLGVGSQVLEMLRNICHRLNLAGLITVPSYFHNAFFYSKEFFHLLPENQGAFLALCRDVIPQTEGNIVAASWALQWEMIRDLKEEEAQRPFSWIQTLMVNPIDPKLRAHFETQSYRQQVQQALTLHDFQVFKGALRRGLQTRGIFPLNQELLQGWINEQ